ncbi:MAG: CvpA family protein [Prevotellaceae bacterium]|jgi:membrane protein required for colicin V production|nr:CvpA family protein [Prevotellaceae bacterium]
MNISPIFTLVTDAVIGVALLIALVVGVKKGFVRQLFGLAALFLGVYCAFKFSHVAGQYLSGWLHTNERATGGIAFAVVFVGVLLLVILAGRVASRILSLAMLGGFDKLLGGVFSVLKIVCVLCVVQFITQYLDAQFHFLPDDVRTSVFYRFFDTVCRLAFPYLSGKL